MIRFTRTAVVKNTAILPKAIGFASELVGYLNTHYKVDIRTGVEQFNRGRIHWMVDLDSLDHLDELNQKMMADRHYFSMLETGQHYWVEGSVRDNVINLVS